MQTVRDQKTDEKNWVICLVFMTPCWVIVLKLSNIVSFLQFLANVIKTSTAVIAIYVHVSESSCFALLENGIWNYAMT